MTNETPANAPEESTPLPAYQVIGGGEAESPEELMAAIAAFFNEQAVAAPEFDSKKMTRDLRPWASAEKFGKWLEDNEPQDVSPLVASMWQRMALKFHMERRHRFLGWMYRLKFITSGAVLGWVAGVLYMLAVGGAS